MAFKFTMFPSTDVVLIIARSGGTVAVFKRVF